MRNLLLGLVLVSFALGASGCDKGNGGIEAAKLSEFSEYSGVKIKALPDERIAVIRNVDTVFNLSNNFKELFHWFVVTQTEVAGYNTTLFAESPASISRTDNERRIFYYVGMPVPDKVYGSGPVKIYTFTKSRAVCMLHYGDYNNLPESWQKLLGWAAANGLEPSGLYREVYITGPGPNDPVDPARWITELVLPVKD